MTDTPERSAEAPAGRSRREQVRLASGAAVVVLTTLFAVFNLDKVKVDWVVGTSRAPLILVILIAVIAGALLGWIGAGRRRRE